MILSSNFITAEMVGEHEGNSDMVKAVNEQVDRLVADIHSVEDYSDLRQR